MRPAAVRTHQPNGAHPASEATVVVRVPSVSRRTTRRARQPTRYARSRTAPATAR